MNLANTTFSAFILYALDKDQISNPLVQHKMAAFIGLIKQRVQSDGVERALASLQEDAFQMRLLILNLFSENEITDRLPEGIERLYQRFDKPAASLGPDLNKALPECMTVYRFIAGLETEGESGTVVKEPMSDYMPVPVHPGKVDTLPSLADLELILKTFGFGSTSIISLLRSSLAFETGLILAELHRAGELFLSPAELKELSRQLFLSIEDFGLEAHTQGFWQLPYHDHVQTIRNIKIRVAAYEASQIGSLKEVSFQSLKELLS
ncbi:hypothetical protein AB9P05_12840 [Roseivirga sp. BDSF3-8]|uniref:hypothetical protein n=1 Tax=Roseivirga sp. BDSF3-8 TaxID=3241598 RepID=UPI003531C78A